MVAQFYCNVRSMLLNSRHAKIAVGWVACTVLGLSSFYLAKKSVDRRRYDVMKSRERMRDSNKGEYDPSYRKFSTKS